MQQPLQLIHSHSLKYRSGLAYCNTTLSFHLTGFQEKENLLFFQIISGRNIVHTMQMWDFCISYTFTVTGGSLQIQIVLVGGCCICYCTLLLFRDKRRCWIWSVYSQQVKCLHRSFQTWVWFWSFSLSHIENDLKMILQKRFRQHTKLLFFRKQRNNYNSLLLCILCKLFLLLSQVSIEPKLKNKLDASKFHTVLVLFKGSPRHGW